ncbi:MAG: hypothetical protein PHT99_09215 [Methanoregula sp.]|nr:hypothetical protein [Methanoregula sp.]
MTTVPYAQKNYPCRNIDEIASRIDRRYIESEKINNLWNPSLPLKE